MLAFTEGLYGFQFMRARRARHYIIICIYRSVSKPGYFAREIGYILETVQFLARDSMSLARYMLPPVRPSVCPSVTRVDQSKPVEVRLMQFSPYGSPIPLVFVGVSFIQKF